MMGSHEDLGEAFENGYEEMRRKVVAFLEQRATQIEESEKGNSHKFYLREAMALREASQLIREGKKYLGGFEG
jgi:hypothetical protein